MSASEDVRNLFGKFEGKSQGYQEVARDDQTVEARSRWPLLSSLALEETDVVPGVDETPAHHGLVAAPVHQSSSSDAVNRQPSLRGALFGHPGSSAPSVASAIPPVVSPAEPVAPVSAFSPPRAATPRPEPTPFVRGAGPAFRVHTGPAVTDTASEPVRYPPVVTPETSRRRSPLAGDFAPPVVPVNQFKPSSSPITGIEHEPAMPGPIPKGSILGRMFAPAIDEQASETRDSGYDSGGSRDLQSVFGRLSGRSRRHDAGGT